MSRAEQDRERAGWEEVVSVVEAFAFRDWQVWRVCISSGLLRDGDDGAAADPWTYADGEDPEKLSRRAKLV